MRGITSQESHHSDCVSAIARSKCTVNTFKHFTNQHQPRVHTSALVLILFLSTCNEMKPTYMHYLNRFIPFHRGGSGNLTMFVLLTRGALLYLATVNSASAGVFAYDKFQAIHSGWRVSEKRLCQTALLGGWLGGLAAMHVLRHKTRKTSFQRKYATAITQNAVLVTPAVLLVSAVPALRNGFATALRGSGPPRKPPRNPPRFSPLKFFRS